MALAPLYERTHILVGDAGTARLRAARLLLAGLGGVGAYAAEALARAGVGHLTLVDHDQVAGSNLNRQLPALHSTLGRPKTEVVAARLRDINPDLSVRIEERFIQPDNVDGLLAPGYDFVIDAIDSLNCKAALVITAHQQGLPVAASMGAGGRLDPTRVRVTDLLATDVCPLARQMRKRLRRQGVGKGILAVWSDENPRPPLPPQPTDQGRDRAVNGTISYMPALFGLTLAGVVLQHLLGETA